MDSILIKGGTASGKTQWAMKQYSSMINEQEINSDDILVLVLNRGEVYKWLENIDVSSASSLRVSSYFGFVQKEIKRFWPLILKKGKMIKKLEINPVFMTFESSQDLMSKTVSFYRSKGYFSSINSNDDEIARKLLSNILSASSSNISYKKIGSLLKVSQEEGDAGSVYDEMDEVISKYIERTIEEGVLDYSITLYLYENYLLNDSLYLENFFNRTKYLIVDNIELASIAQLDFIFKVSKHLEKCIYLYNTDGSFGIYSYNRDYIEEFLENVDEVLELGEDGPEFLNTIQKNLLLEQDTKLNTDKLELYLGYELRTDMNREVLKKVRELLDDGVDPGEISVICPKYDIVLEYSLSKLCRNRGIKFLNIGRNERILDNNYVYALIVFACIFYNFKDSRLSYDELKVFLSIVLETELITSSLIVNYIGSASGGYNKLVPIDSGELEKRIPAEILKRYGEIISFLNKLEPGIGISEFFKKVYMDMLLGNGEAIENIRACKDLIDSSENFVRVMESFQLIGDSNSEFVKFIRGGSKAAENLYDIEEKAEGGYLSISTPFSYLVANRRSRYQIWTDAKSSIWTVKTKNLLQNPWVLTKTWKQGRIFDMETEIQKEKEDLMATISRLIKSCSERIYIYGCKYSNSGYVQENFLSQVLERSLDKEIV